MTAAANGDTCREKNETPGSIRVMLVQMNSTVGDKEANFEVYRKFINKAKAEEVNLVVFPELSATGYLCYDSFYKIAEPIPGPFTSRVASLLAGSKVHVVFGMPEACSGVEGTLYNSVVLMGGKKGLIGKYRKWFLPGHSVFDEKRYFTPGSKAEVFSTCLGDMALGICYDIYFPELARFYALKGAEILIYPTASPSARKDFFEVLTKARAIENGVFVILCNLAGVEENLVFWGGSHVVSPAGTVVAKAKYDEEDSVVAELDLTEVRRTRPFLPMLSKDVRLELYDKLATHHRNASTSLR
ncbi:MAG: carbon-nitrogen hydrolase family protein [Promethearchaeati archaeon SRVP18_Atabeyarchaeia-1]